MTDQEILNKTDWRAYRKEKSRAVIESLGAALTCRQTPKSRELIGNALLDAAKLFKLELELSAGTRFDGLHTQIQPDNRPDSVSPTGNESLH